MGWSFLIYINDLHKAIKYSKVRHFADDTNLLINNNSPKQLQKQLNMDLRNLCNWLKANKISLNASKTELLIFRHPNKKINYEFKLKIDGKKLIPSKFVKYLGVLIDSHLNWSFHLNLLSTKLSRANGMLARIRHFVSKHTLHSIYFGIFSSLLTYNLQIWGQTKNNQFRRIESLQNKAIRLINFATYRASVNPLYKASKILKLSDVVKLQNFLLVLDDVKGKLPTALSNTFHLVKNAHNLNTRGATHYKMVVPAARTLRFGIRRIKFQSVQVWNYFMCHFHNIKIQENSKNVCKNILTNHFLELY